MTGESFAYYYAMQINKQKKKHAKKFKSTIPQSTVTIYFDNPSSILIIHYSILWQSVNVLRFIFLS